MVKRLLLALIAVGGVLVAVACTLDRDHDRAHWRAFKQDAHDMHTFIDRHFFNYDEDDPDRY